MSKAAELSRAPSIPVFGPIDRGLITTKLDDLGQDPNDVPRVEEPRVTHGARGWWRNPIGIAVGAITLVGLGTVLGAGVARYTTRAPRAAPAAAFDLGNQRGALPPGEDRVRVTKMIADAKAGTLPRP